MDEKQREKIVSIQKLKINVISSLLISERQFKYSAVFFSFFFNDENWFNQWFICHTRKEI